VCVFPPLCWSFPLSSVYLISFLAFAFPPPPTPPLFAGRSEKHLDKEVFDSDNCSSDVSSDAKVCTTASSSLAPVGQTAGVAKRKQPRVVAPQLSDYEKEREKRVHKNMAVLESLGFNNARVAMIQTSDKLSGRGLKPKRNTVPTRSSDRIKKTSDVCMYVFVHAYMCVCVFMYVCVCMLTCMCVHVCTCVHVCVVGCACAHTVHTPACTCVYLFLSLSLSPPPPSFPQSNL
jgi:hypothetical protein